MALTLGMTGMDRKTEAEVQAAFKIANSETGNQWILVDGDNADFVLIDMDSLYGPMSWLRLHSMGRKVIGLTSVDRQQTDYRLPHPVNATNLTVLLSEIAADPQPRAKAEDTPSAPAAPAPLKPAPAEIPPPVQAVAPEPVPAHVPEPEPIAPAPPTSRTLLHWLEGRRITKRVRLQRTGQPVLLIDPQAATWHGSSSLKPLAVCFDGELTDADFSLPDTAAWNAEAASLGAAQPLSRLLWLGGLVSNLPVDGKYVLKKWPQTEREYPKHFRIATVMMKGPAGVAEIAEASGVSAEEVEAFINANLVTGYAEPVSGSPSPSSSQKQAGLFGRMRGT